MAAPTPARLSSTRFTLALLAALPPLVLLAPAPAHAEASPRAPCAPPSPGRGAGGEGLPPPCRAEASPARPKSPVTWSAVTAPKGDQKPRLEKALRKLLERETAEADWGRAAREGLEGSFALKRLEHAVDRGVLRVHCAASGRLRDGRPASSTFTLGGRPEERASLERRALTLAVRGVVVRLAELARSAARPRVRVSAEPGEF